MQESYSVPPWVIRVGGGLGGLVILLTVFRAVGATGSPAPTVTPISTPNFTATAVPLTNTPFVVTATPRSTETPTLTPLPSLTPSPTATVVPTSTTIPSATPSVTNWCVAMSQQWLFSSPNEDSRFHAGFVREGEAVGVVREGLNTASAKDWVRAVVRRGDAESTGWLRFAWLSCP